MTPEPANAAPFEPTVVRQWLVQVAETQPRTHPSLGLGEALRWQGPNLTAAALALDGSLVHFVGFPLDQASGDAPHRSRMQSASWRCAPRAE